jgi:hypothetical protein
MVLVSALRLTSPISRNRYRRNTQASPHRSMIAVFTSVSGGVDTTVGGLPWWLIELPGVRTITDGAVVQLFALRMQQMYIFDRPACHYTIAHADLHGKEGAIGQVSDQVFVPRPMNGHLHKGRWPTSRARLSFSCRVRSRLAGRPGPTYTRTVGAPGADTSGRSPSRRATPASPDWQRPDRTPGWYRRTHGERPGPP